MGSPMYKFVPAPRAPVPGRSARQVLTALEGCVGARDLPAELRARVLAHHQALAAALAARDVEAIRATSERFANGRAVFRIVRRTSREH